MLLHLRETLVSEFDQALQVTDAALEVPEPLVCLLERFLSGDQFLLEGLQTRKPRVVRTFHRSPGYLDTVLWRIGHRRRFDPGGDLAGTFARRCGFCRGRASGHRARQPTPIGFEIRSLRKNLAPGLRRFDRARSCLVGYRHDRAGAQTIHVGIIKRLRILAQQGHQHLI